MMVKPILYMMDYMVTGIHSNTIAPTLVLMGSTMIVVLMLPIMISTWFGTAFQMAASGMEQLTTGMMVTCKPTTMELTVQPFPRHMELTMMLNNLFTTMVRPMSPTTDLLEIFTIMPTETITMVTLDNTTTPLEIPNTP